MINLLPPKEKEELSLEGNKKLVIVLGNLVLISLVCLILILFSLKFYILKEISYQKIVLDNTEKKYQASNFLSFKEIIQKYNANLVKIDNFYKKEIKVSDILKTILEVPRPEGLYFENISVENNKNGTENKKTKVTISGISKTRDNLLIFKENIENSKTIENVYFPPSNWVKNKDINFYLTLETKEAILAK